MTALHLSPFQLRADCSCRRKLNLRQSLAPALPRKAPARSAKAPKCESPRSAKAPRRESPRSAKARESPIAKAPIPKAPEVRKPPKRENFWKPDPEIPRSRKPAACRKPPECERGRCCRGALGHSGCNHTIRHLARRVGCSEGEPRRHGPAADGSGGGGSFTRQGLSPSRVFHATGSFTRQGLSPGGVFHPAGYFTRQRLSLGRVFHPVGSFTRQGLSPGRIFHPAGSFTHGIPSHRAARPRCRRVGQQEFPRATGCTGCRQALGRSCLLWIFRCICNGVFAPADPRKPREVRKPRSARTPEARKSAKAQSRKPRGVRKPRGAKSSKVDSSRKPHYERSG